MLKIPKFLPLTPSSPKKDKVTIINFSLFHQPAKITNNQDITVNLSLIFSNYEGVNLVFQIDNNTVKLIEDLEKIEENNYQIIFSSHIIRKLSYVLKSIIFEGLSFTTCYFINPSHSLYIAQSYIAIDGDCLQKIDKKSLENRELYESVKVHYWLVKKFFNGLKDNLEKQIYLLLQRLNISIAGINLIGWLGWMITDILQNILLGLLDFILGIILGLILKWIYDFSKKFILNLVLELILNYSQHQKKVILLKISAVIIISVLTSLSIFWGIRKLTLFILV